jgi:dynein light intermediate chain 1
MKEALDDMQLEEGVLNVNLGIPIMIICTKTDIITSGESMKYFHPRFEFIFKHLREFALRYGASIIFTSTKKGTNMDL